MTSVAKIPHGTPAWFDMVGSLLIAAASRAGLAPTLNVSLVERYSDGALMGDGLVRDFASTSSAADRRSDPGRGGTKRVT